MIMVEAAGIEPATPCKTKNLHQPDRSDTFPVQKRTLIDTRQEVRSGQSTQKLAFSMQNQNKSGQKKCATCVRQDSIALQPDLAELIGAWEKIPEEVKAGILAMVKAVLEK